MEVQELGPGLWRWTAPHPGWREGADWPRDVGCVYFEAPEDLVLFDPQIPSERDRFLAALDRDVERLGRPVVILLTVPWHARSADELAQRYGGRIGGPVDGVVGHRFPDVEETVYWLAEQRTLIVGESLFGDGGGRLSLCPDTWVKGERRASLRASLRTLLELPVERILVSHGEPVLESARAALERSLEA